MSETALWATVVGMRVRKRVTADIEKWLDMCIMNENESEDGNDFFHQTVMVVIVQEAFKRLFIDKAKHAGDNKAKG